MGLQDRSSSRIILLLEFCDFWSGSIILAMENFKGQLRVLNGVEVDVAPEKEVIALEVATALETLV